MNTPTSKPLECFQTDPNTKYVRFRIKPKKSIQLPYEHLAYSEFDAEGEVDQEVLILWYDTHKVTIRGHALRHIESALRLRHLSCVCPTGGPAEAQLSYDATTITHLEIEAASQSEKPPSAREPVEIAG